MLGGESINDYKLQECIGEGGYGRVYRATGVDNQTYALKVIQISPKSKQKMRQQGIILASLKHPNILWAREFFYYQQEKYFVIVTEFCGNGSLEDKIQQLPSTILYPLMIGIAEGLKYLHDKNIIHRDIKPENILLSGQVPKIADMGVAKVIKSMRATTKIGTPFYMAFEIFQNDYDFSADIWALGIIFLELTLKKRIFEMLKGEQIPSKRLKFPSQQLLNQIQDKRLRIIISLMLKRQPQQRIKIKQILKMLTDIQQPDLSQIAINRKTIKTSSREIVEDCYNKTKQYFYCKHTLNFIKQMYENHMLEIISQSQINNRKALYLLAKMHFLGVGMAKDQQKAQEIYIKAYELEEPLTYFQLYLSCTSSNEKYHYLIYGKMLFNDQRCLSKLAQNYLQGLEGKDIDYQESYEILLDLVDKNYPPGLYLMAKLNSIKNTQFYNPQQSKDYFSKGSQLGQPKCKLKQAEQLLKQKKYAQCLKICNQSDFQEQFTQRKDRLMVFHLKARCLRRLKDQKTVEYYEKCLQLDGQNMQKDYRGELAEYYASVKKYSLAINLYNEAILRILDSFKNQESSEFCKKRLEYLCGQLYMIYCEQQMLAQAFQIAEISYNLGHENGKADYGYMIYFGMGTQKNVQLGYRILLALVEDGNEAAVDYFQLIQRQ